MPVYISICKYDLRTEMLINMWNLIWYSCQISKKNSNLTNLMWNWEWTRKSL